MQFETMLCDLSQEEVRAVLSYSKSTGFLHWRGRNRIAGSLHSSGYIHVKINSRLYKAHRLAWVYVTGEWPVLDVEHKNRNKSDNRWCNLRQANDSLNQANASIRVDNSSGFKSVHLRKEDGKYRARIQVRGTRHHLGYFRTAKLAHAAYIKAAKEHFGEFARAR